MPSRRTQAPKKLWLPTPEEIEAAKLEIRQEWAKEPSSAKPYVYKSKYVRIVKVCR